MKHWGSSSVRHKRRRLDWRRRGGGRCYLRRSGRKFERISSLRFEPERIQVFKHGCTWEGQRHELYVLPSFDMGHWQYDEGKPESNMKQHTGTKTVDLGLFGRSNRFEQFGRGFRHTLQCAYALCNDRSESEHLATVVGSYLISSLRVSL